MKAQINKVNEGTVLVSLFNNERVVNQKWFDTERKANNFCAKYKYEICQMSKNVDYAQMFNK